VGTEKVETLHCNDTTSPLRFYGAVLLFLLLAACTPTPLPLSPLATPTPSDLYLAAEDVILYPGPGLYEGDVVTFDVVPRNLGGINPYEIDVRVYRREEVVAEGSVGYPTFDGVPRARLVWAWDTTGIEGEETLTIWLDPQDEIQEGDDDPDDNIVTHTVQLLPADERHPVEIGAAWDTTTTDCCTFHYMAGTAAERDLATIAAMTEEAVTHVQEKLDARLTAPLDVYLVGRVIGHGGYALDGLVISYLDRHYAGDVLETVLRHETAHILDAETLTEWSPALVREGLATWAAGGHFKPEPIPQRAAALVRLDRYVPLEPLANDFYLQQHETGYLEGAALVAYLVETYGWDGFLRFYTAFDDSYETPAETLDAALSETVGAGLAETEKRFLRWLEEHPPTPDQARDLELTIRLFDTIRRYQQDYDPSAYLMSGWLPNPAQAESLGITADFLRHPRTAENITLELMLAAAYESLRAGAFDRVEGLLDEVNGVLQGGNFTTPLAADYMAAVQAATAAGCETQRVEIEGEVARVWAIADWPTLTELTLKRVAEEWAVTQAE